MGATDRGVSPVVGVAMMIVIVVALVAVVGGGFLGMGGMLEDPGPYSGVETDAEISTSGQDCDDETVQLTHMSGDAVDVETMEIIVDTENHEEAVLTNLPIESTNNVSDKYIDGNDDLIDQRQPSVGCTSGPIVEDGPDEWGPGTTIEFRVNHGAPNPEIEEGDEITITIVDTETETIVTREELEATG